MSKSVSQEDVVAHSDPVDLEVANDQVSDGEQEEYENVPQSEDAESDDIQSDNDNLSDDDSEGSDEEESSSDIEIDEAAPEEEGEEEEKPVLFTEDDIPGILTAIESEDAEASNAALTSLNNIPANQPELISDNLPIFDIPRLLKVAETCGDERRSRIIEFFTCLPSLANEPRDILLPHLPALVGLLSQADVSERQHILYIIDDFADNVPDTHATIITCAKALFEPWLSGISDPEPASYEEKFIAVLETFENTIIYSREQTRKLFIQGNAFNTAVSALSIQKYPKIRLAGASVLNGLFDYASEVDESSPIESELGKTLHIIISSLVNLICDPDPKVSEFGAQFLTTDRESPVLDVIGVLLESNLDIGVALVRQLGNKRPGTVGATCEYALIKLVENEDWKKVAVSGFNTLWTSTEISNKVKLAVVRGLIDSFTVLREVAAETGICVCMMKMSLDDNDAVEAMTIFDKMLETEQAMGFVLIETDGAIDHYIRLIESSSSAEVRRLAASTLARTLDSTKDGALQRPAVFSLLTEPALYNRILASLRSSDPTTINAVAKLLAEILLEEDGTKGWSYDEDSGLPPPPCPVKERTVTEELVSYTINLLKRPETAVGAMTLLCQFCWGYQPGFDIVQKSFESVIPDADVFFLAALDGDFVNRHTGRQRRVVGDAAVKAGGLERAIALLEEEHQSPEIRRTAVEAFRVMLAAESTDAEVGRKNTKLPSVLAATIADKTLASLNTTLWMVRLVHNETFTYEYPAWAEFSTPETIDALVYWMNQLPEEVPAPADEEYSEDSIYKSIEHDNMVRKVEKDHQHILAATGEIIDAMAPVLAQYSAQLIGPILKCTNTEQQNDGLLGALKKLVAEGSDPQSDDILVSSVKELLSQAEPPSFSNCESWITKGPKLASAFYLGGILDCIFNVYDPEKEDVYSYASHNPLRALLSLVQTVEDPEHLLGIKVAFFQNVNALNRALEFVRNPDSDSIYDAWQSCEELGALCSEYPEGIAALEDIYPHVLKVFDHEDLGRPSDIAPLIAALCHFDIDQLVTLLRSFVSGLKPPNNGPEPPLAGKKKGKKSKKFSPRLSISQVLERFNALIGANSATTRAAYDAGVIEVVSQALSGDSEEARDLAFQILQSILDSGEEEYDTAIEEVLPKCLDLFVKEIDPKDPNLKLLCTSVEKHLPRVIEIGAIPVLYKGLSHSLGDHTMLIDVLHAIGLRDPEYLTGVIKEAMEAEDALVQENFWGNTYAIRRLIAEGDSSASIVANAGASDYAVRLLQSEDLQHVTKGAALSATLVRIKSLELRDKLVELGIPALIEEGHAKCVAASKTLDPATEDPEDEAEVERREKLRNVDSWIQVLSNASVLMSGEDIEEYEEDYYL